ncbi:MAG TPA: helix-turn-helix domain-containing protein [Usitatibacter sp.]|nr:helix-turn-helix domain-containing protein [Usitatibacter sp.]
MEAAALLGIGRNTLTRKVQDLKIDTPPHDEGGPGR